MERLALSTKLRIGDGENPEVFTTVLDVRELSAPNLQLGTENTTNHSQDDFWEQMAGTLLDGGDVSLMVLYDPSDPTHQQLLADIQARTIRNFEMQFPGDTTNALWAFSGFFTAFQPQTPTDALLKVNCTIALTASVGISTPA